MAHQRDFFFDTSLDLRNKAEYLLFRIKNTATIRFSASRRQMFNFMMGKLTIVILSVWAILISFLATTEYFDFSETQKQMQIVIGLILPVFIVLFSFIEGGENFLKAHQFEMNARALRELADEYYAEMDGAIAQPSDKSDGALRDVLHRYYIKYNDTLERSPVNHDEVDYYGAKYSRLRRDAPNKGIWAINFGVCALVWGRRQIQRIAYAALWVLPSLLFFNFGSR